MTLLVFYKKDIKMKKQLINSFEKGINTDLHPLNIPKTTMSDALNASITTNGEEQLILQNAEGLEYKTTLPSGFEPVAAKEHNGIVYIISSNRDSRVTVEVPLDPNSGVPLIDITKSNNFELIGDEYKYSLGINSLSGITHVSGKSSTASVIVNSLPNDMGIEAIGSNTSIDLGIDSPYVAKDFFTCETIVSVPSYTITGEWREVRAKLGGRYIFHNVRRSGPDFLLFKDAIDNIVASMNTKKTFWSSTDPLPSNFSIVTESINDTSVKIIFRFPKGSTNISTYIGNTFEMENITLDSNTVTITNSTFPSFDTTIGDKLSLKIDTNTEVIYEQVGSPATVNQPLLYFSNNMPAGYTATISGSVLTIHANNNSSKDGVTVTMTKTDSGPAHNSWTIPIIPPLSGYTPGTNSPMISLIVDGTIIKTYQTKYNDTISDICDGLVGNDIGNIKYIIHNYNSVTDKNILSLASTETTALNGKVVQLTSDKPWITNPTITNFNNLGVEVINASYIRLKINNNLVASYTEEVGDTPYKAIRRLEVSLGSSDLIKNYGITTELNGNTMTLVTSTLHGDVEIGTYPGFKPLTTDTGAVHTPVELVDEYQPLYNYYDGHGDIDSDASYNSRFRTKLIPISVGSEVDIQIQNSYDNSVNIIFTDGLNDIRLVNSRFKPYEGTHKYIVAERRQKLDINVYGDHNLDITKLILEGGGSIPKLELVGIENSGALKVGGYRFYFRYEDADGNVSNIIEESRLVSIFFGDTPYTSTAGKEGDVTSKNVKFKLSNLDPIYSSIKVYFTLLSGENVVTPTIYTLNNNYKISNTGTTDINITGLEATSIIEETALTVSYSNIKSSKALAQNDDRLLLGNISSEVGVFDDLEQFAKGITVSAVVSDDIDFPVSVEDKINPGYSDPLNIYNHLGYWAGETYEVGVVFITPLGNTPVFPVSGKDFETNNQLSDLPGVIRTKRKSNIVNNKMKAIKLAFNVPDEVKNLSNVNGLFFVRRERIKNARYQGLMSDCYSAIADRIPSNSVKVPLMTGPRLGYGPKASQIEGWNYNWAPCPGHLAEFTLAKSKIKPRYAYNYLYRGQPTGVNNIKKSFYSGDLLANPLIAASYFIEDKTIYSLGYVQEIDTQTWLKDQQGTYGFRFPGSNYSLNSRLVPYKNFNQNFTKLKFTPTFVDTGFESHENNGFTGFVNKSLIIKSDDVDQGYAGEAKTTLEQNWIDPYGITEKKVTVGNDYTIPLVAKYQSYVGVTLDSEYPGSGVIDPLLEKSNSEHWGYNWDFTYCSDYWSLNVTNLTFDTNNIKLGHLANVYDSGGFNSTTTLKTIYKERFDYPYFAISNRISVSDAKGTHIVAGGDCYTGLNSCRIWFKGGDPKVTDASTLPRADAAGHENSGFLMSWLSENNYNTSVRMKEYVEGEQTLFGNNRSHFPVRPIDTIKSSYQYDTTLYNKGISSEFDMLNYFSEDLKAPLINYSYPNRIMASAKAIQSQFRNGYRNFMGSNYRDYSSDLGPIVKLISFRNFTYLLCVKGISMIQVNQQTLVGTEDQVQVDTAKILPQRDTVISNIYGIQTLDAADYSNFAIYGIDAFKNVIWQLKDNQFSIISTYNVQKKLDSFKKELEDFKATVVTDKINHKVFFTYTNKDVTKSRTLVYNESLSIWESEMEYHPKLIAQTKKDLIMFDTLGDKGELYNFVIGKTCKFKNVQKKFEIEFVINDMTELQKILTNMQLVSSLIAPEKIIYTTNEDDPLTITDKKVVEQTILSRENGYSISKANCQLINDKVEIVCQRDWEANDTSRANRRNRGHNRDIRDKYIRVRLIYSGDKKVVIQKIISNVTLNN